MQRDNVQDDCPTRDFEIGEPGGMCFGDGHFMCLKCKNLRADLVNNRSEKIGTIYTNENISITELNANNDTPNRTATEKY